MGFLTCKSELAQYCQCMQTISDGSRVSVWVNADMCVEVAGSAVEDIKQEEGDFALNG